MEPRRNNLHDAVELGDHASLLDTGSDPWVPKTSSGASTRDDAQPGAPASADTDQHSVHTQLGLRSDELAFYDAVCQNDSAVMEMGDDVLRQIARDLVDAVRANTTVDWDKKEQVRANMRRHIRRLLTKYHYPPDKQESAIALVMEQAEALARDTTP